MTVAVTLAAAALMTAAAMRATMTVSAAATTAADGGCGSDFFLVVSVLQVLSVDSINPKWPEASGSGRKRPEADESFKR